MVNIHDADWLAEHGLDLSAQYPNKWVAVYNGEVIGSGDTLGEAADQAMQRRPQRDFILEHINIDVDIPHVH